MKKLLLIWTAFLGLTVAHGQATIDLTSGGSGSTTSVPQSFNETRGVDITIKANPIFIYSVTLHRFCTGTVNDSGYVGLRIYDSGTKALLFSQDSVVNPIYDSAVTFSYAQTWLPGQSFRISFFCYGYGNNNTSGSGYMYQPTFPYDENFNLIQINQAYQSLLDTFPNNTNIFVPFITLGYSPFVHTNEIENISTLSISPNPFSTQTTLWSANPLSNATLTVDNCFGQTVAQIKNLRGQTITFNRDNLASGLYFVRLTEDNKIFTDKLIITDK